nr:MAG TPA: hypothetical protein [Caudoviricetes sp.]
MFVGLASFSGVGPIFIRSLTRVVFLFWPKTYIFDGRLLEEK